MKKKCANRDNCKSTDQIIKDYLSSNDDDYAWQLLGILHSRGTPKELNAAISLCKSNDPDMRELGTDILGQLGGGSHPFVEDSIGILISLLTDKHTSVVCAAVHALGHLEDNRAIPGLISLRDSPYHEIRSGVAFALGLTSESDNKNAVDALIELSKDRNPEVRDWAIFSLGTQMTVDRYEVREALWDRIEDETNWDVYCEAVTGLALRKDPRIFNVICSEFKKDNPPTLFNAIVSLEEYSLLPLLKRLLKKVELEKNEDNGIKQEWLEHLKNCIVVLSRLDPSLQTDK